MVEKIILEAKQRAEEKKTNTLRQEGLLPAVLYGHGEKNINLILDYNQFIRVYKSSGSSSLVGLKVDDKRPINVIIQEVQTNPVSDQIIHVDFYKVKMDEKITTEIKLVFEGEAPAVKELSGTLIKNYDALEIECLPGDLIPEIKVDVSGLKKFHNSITVENLNLPEILKPLINEEEVIATVIPPQIEKKPVEITEEAEVAEGEEKVEEVAEGEEKEVAAKKKKGEDKEEKKK